MTTRVGPVGRLGPRRDGKRKGTLGEAKSEQRVVYHGAAREGASVQLAGDGRLGGRDRQGKGNDLRGQAMMAACGSATRPRWDLFAVRLSWAPRRGSGVVWCVSLYVCAA